MFLLYLVCKCLKVQHVLPEWLGLKKKRQNDVSRATNIGMDTTPYPTQKLPHLVILFLEFKIFCMLFFHLFPTFTCHFHR